MTTQNIFHIHTLTALPLVKRLMETDVDNNFKPLLKDYLKTVLRLREMTPLEEKYLRYCLNAYDPPNRDYSLLRDILALQVVNYEEEICKQLVQVTRRSLDVDTIYDIGSGHDQWSRLLHQRIWPHARVIQIDKAIIKPYHLHYQMTVDEWLKNFVGMSSSLVFMSEFLHCKRDYINYLNHPEIQKCQILINELWPDSFVDARLHMTGGRTIHPSDTWESLAEPVLSVYEMLFTYYLIYSRPKNDMDEHDNPTLPQTIRSQSGDS